MSISCTARKGEQGFTLLETTFAILILGIGLLGAAALLAQMFGNSVQSRYMSTESLLASEKLDDLNRLASSDPALMPSPATSLTTDATAVQTVGAVTETVAYYDTVQISAGNGAMQEVITGTDAAGNTIYMVNSHTPNGNISSTTSPTAPAAPDAQVLTFKRRWLVEGDTPIVGARRITVQVNLVGGAANATFQTSMIRSFVQ
ncbi:MAG TPA: prepilin-type N-terminal cleavage/methylation domain-containing protein [Candidatus Angelobacter sp.]|jgi:prepilin-type N-terminal cleavage/methylation domain-containing protein|nr:prepilin-type N-terminal cleavage/methylation domain-containing protein [Candidatus Angelobacter sp.]